MRLELRCLGTFTLNLERWSDHPEGRVCLPVLILWPSVAFISRDCMGLFWPFYRLPGLAVGGFESLPLYAAFIYMMGILFRIVLSRFEVNMSCRLIFNSVETFNLSVRS